MLTEARRWFGRGGVLSPRALSLALLLCSAQVHLSSAQTTAVQQWGEQGDIPVVGTFDGSGLANFAVWRPSNGTWYLLPAAGSGPVTSKQWGAPTDVPVAADFDGDGKTDIAVWRPSTGTWYIIQSSNNLVVTRQWGAPTDKPVLGDFDGDGKTDIAVWRPSTGTWYIIQSSNNQVVTRQWGAPTDQPVLGDFDGDGKTDIAVWRPSNGNWYIVQSSDNEVVTHPWGDSTDIPVPRDYDGDGKTDIAVWRPSNGEWYLISSGTGEVVSQSWGEQTDIPVPGLFGAGQLAVWRPSNGSWYVSQPTCESPGSSSCSVAAAPLVTLVPSATNVTVTLADLYQGGSDGGVGTLLSGPGSTNQSCSTGGCGFSAAGGSFKGTTSIADTWSQYEAPPATFNSSFEGDIALTGGATPKLAASVNWSVSPGAFQAAFGGVFNVTTTVPYVLTIACAQAPSFSRVECQPNYCQVSPALCEGEPNGRYLVPSTLGAGGKVARLAKSPAGTVQYSLSAGTYALKWQVVGGNGAECCLGTVQGGPGTASTSPSLSVGFRPYGSVTPNLQLTPASPSIGMGSTVTLSASENGNPISASSLKWVSSDETIAKVADGVVTGVGVQTDPNTGIIAGIANITATNPTTGTTASAVVLVRANQWEGTWNGVLTSTCGYPTAPYSFVIWSTGGNALTVTENTTESFGLQISSTNPNVAAYGTNALVFTISGDTMTLVDSGSCQTGTLTRQ